MDIKVLLTTFPPPWDRPLEGDLALRQVQARPQQEEYPTLSVPLEQGLMFTIVNQPTDWRFDQFALLDADENFLPYDTFAFERGPDKIYWLGALDPEKVKHLEIVFCLKQG